FVGRDTLTFPTPAVASTNCFFRVAWKSNPSVFDTNDASFWISGLPPLSYWQTQASGTTVPLYSVKAISPFVAWTGGTGGVVRRTTDGGNTWISAGAIGGDIYALTALDANIALVAAYTGASARILKTTNGGLIWTTTDNIAGGFYNAVEMNSPTTGLALGDPIAGNWLMRRTTNTGTTWFAGPTIPSLPNEIMWNNCLTLYDSLHGWFYTSPNSVYRTTSGGTGWTKISTPPLAGPVWFNQLTLGLSGPRLRSTDAGGTWALTAGTIAETVTGISGMPGSENFWATGGNKVYYSSNTGDSWSNAPPYGYNGTRALNHISMIRLGNITAGWAVGAGGTIVGFIVGPDEVGDKSEITHEYSLSQNYPNPFNPVTTIRYTIPVGTYGHTSLRVFDLLGREVATLVNEEKPPGAYQVTWDAHNFANGVYFYRLNAGSFTIAKRMLLIK
ncbi:MAG: hypothetical protein HW412_1335, partial [Bacteroidetes bacterium]|nr:hypothetical protein [Bacteroidota bacterium]